MSNNIINLVEICDDYRDRFIVEEIEDLTTKKKQKYLKGIYGQFEMFNINERYYQLKEGKKEISRFNEEVIPRRRALGELDHSKESAIQLHRTSHIFEEPLYFDGNNMMGKSRILDTQYGKTLSVLVDEKIPFGVSTKATGSLSKFSTKNKSGNLVSNFKLTSPGDVVYKQSAPDAIPSVIMEMVMSGDKRMEEIFNYELIDVSKKILNESSKNIRLAFDTLFDRPIKYINK